MDILGINYIYHDSTACLVRDGELAVAIEEERLTRQKHTGAFPERAIDRCLEIADLAPGDVDHIAISYQPFLDVGRKIAYGLGLGLKGRNLFTSEVRYGRTKQRILEDWLKKTYGTGNRPQVHFVPHHLAHIAGSFYVSPYESAALLSVDGWGEWATTYKGVGRGTALECFGQDYYPYSLGVVYGAATEFCGFRFNYDEGKTMGLAPLGDPERFRETVERVFWINPDMSVGVDLSYFGHQHYGRRCGPRFLETFGSPREQRKDAPFEQHHLDVAAAFQEHLEECMLTLARQLRERTAEEYLVVAGGVALNSVANGRLVRESGFKDVYVMPAAGDNGTAIGAAFWVENGVLGRPRAYVHDDPFVGTAYDDAAIRAVLDDAKLDYRVLPDGELEAATAGLLREGNIVGWFQGRMEIGPRALGNRCILADPTLPGMKDKINAEVKHREPFRPFAPSCPIEDTPRFFEQDVADPFMLKVCDVREDRKGTIPAVTHVDGTARLQTVHRETNPRYHRLLKEFERLSGVPVLLNTSFNVMGEPIVESPLDALRCFYTTGLDYLVLGNHIVGKRAA